MLDLPRSVRLALWGTAVLEDRAAAVDAAEAVRGDDDPHTGAGEDVVPLSSGSTPLHDVLVQLHGRAEGLRAVLPVPGDVLGLPGPLPLTTEAVASGEVVLTVPTSGETRVWALVPDVAPYGSDLEPGTAVAWSVHRAAGPGTADFGGLAEAERALREALIAGTDALAGLDVARWRPDAADRIARLRDGGLPRGAVPAGTPGRVVRVLSTAARVRGIVALASEDDGASVSGFEAERRTRSLRDVDRVARHALVAACDPAAVRRELSR